MGQAIQWAPIKVVPRWNFWIIYYEASEGSEAKSAAKVQDPVRMEISAWAWSFCGTWFGGLSAFQRQTTGGSVTTLCDLLQKSWRLPENDISSWLIFVCIHTYYIYELIICYISYIKYYILCIMYYILYIVYYILYIICYILYIIIYIYIYILCYIILYWIILFYIMCIRYYTI